MRDRRTSAPNAAIASADASVQLLGEMQRRIAGSLRVILVRNGEHSPYKLASSGPITRSMSMPGRESQRMATNGEPLCVEAGEVHRGVAHAIAGNADDPRPLRTRMPQQPGVRRLVGRVVEETVAARRFEHGRVAAVEAPVRVVPRCANRSSCSLACSSGGGVRWNATGSASQPRRSKRPCATSISRRTRRHSPGLMVSDPLAASVAKKNSSRATFSTSLALRSGTGMEPFDSAKRRPAQRNPSIVSPSGLFARSRDR